MARTKEQLIEILANHKTEELFAASTWGDLVASVGGLAQVQKDALLAEIISKNDTQAGYLLKTALINNAKERAKTVAEAILADDQISLSELDNLL